MHYCPEEFRLFCNEEELLRFGDDQEEASDDDDERYVPYDEALGTFESDQVSIPLTCQLTGKELEAGDATRGPLCAHFRAFSKRAYVDLVQAKKGRFVSQVEFLYDELLDCLRQVAKRNGSSDLTQLVKVASTKAGLITGALARYASLQYEICPICHALAPCNALQPAPDFEEAAVKARTSKGTSMVRLPQGWSLGRATRSFHDGLTPIKKACMPAFCSYSHPHQPLCAETFGRVLEGAREALSATASLVDMIDDCSRGKTCQDLDQLSRAATNATALSTKLKSYQLLLSWCPYPACLSSLSLERLEDGSLDQPHNPYAKELKSFQRMVNENPHIIRLVENQEKRRPRKRRKVEG